LLLLHCDWCAAAFELVLFTDTISHVSLLHGTDDTTVATITATLILLHVTYVSFLIMRPLAYHH